MIKKKVELMVSRHLDTIRVTWLKAFAREEARDFDDGYWLMLIHEGSNKMRVEYCEDNNGSLCYFRAIQGHSGGAPISPELMNYTLIPYNWKEHIYHRGISWNFQSVLGSGLIPGGKRERQGSTISLLYSPESIRTRHGRRRP